MPACAGMTAEGETRRCILAAPFAPELYQKMSLRKQRAQGRPGARPRAKKMHGAGTTGEGGITPAFPAQWFYGLYVVSPVTGLFCHRRPQDAEASLRT